MTKAPKHLIAEADQPFEFPWSTSVALPLPNVRREELASLIPAAKGNQVFMFNPRVSVLERDLEIPAITALK